MEYNPHPNSLVLPLCNQTLTLPLTKIIRNLFSVPIVLPFQKCHINGIICTFWVWLLSLSKMLLRFIHVLVCVKSLFPCKKKRRDFFLLLNGVLFMDVKIYPFPSQWTSGLFLIFGYYKWSYCKHLCLGFWMNISFNFTLVNTREWDCCICGDSMFNFVKKKPQNCQIVF